MSALKLVADHWVADQWWLNLVPWSSLIIFCAGWLFGTLWADLWSHDSQLRKWLRGKTNIFEVQKVVGAHRVVDEHEWLFLTLHLKFRHKARNGEFLLHIDGANSHTLKIKERSNYASGEELKLSIARIPNDMHRNGEWGDGTQPNHVQIVGHAKHVATLEIQTENKLWGSQRFSVFVERPVQGTATSGRLFFVPENENLFSSDYFSRPPGGYYHS